MAINEKAKAQIYLDGKQAEAALDGLKRRAKDLRQQLKAAQDAGDNVKLKKLSSEIKGVEAAQRSLRKETFDVERVLNNLNGASMDDLQKALRKTNSEMKRMQRTDPAYGVKAKQAKMLKTEITKVNGAFRQQPGFLKKAGDGFNNYFGIVAAGAASFAGLIMAGRKAVDVFNNFEERVDNLSALTGLEGEQLQWLSDTAKETSIATVEGNVKIKQSADAIVDAYTKVGSQRPELLKNKEALHAVTQDAIILSEAAKTELEPAVAGLTMAINQLGYESDQSRRIINTMTAGSKEGAADIPYLTEAYEKAGTTARLLGVDVEELTGVIEAVAPSYSKASMAGNSFDKVLLKMKANNIGYVDGQFDLIAGIDELKQRYASGETAVDLFGVEHAKMGEILVANRDEVIRYTEAVTGTETALEQASKNTNNNAAKLAQAQNKAELYRIELGEKLSPVMTAFVSKGAMMMKVLSGTIDFLSKYGVQVAIVAGAIATYTAAVKIKANWDKITLAYTKAKMVAEKAYAITSGVVTGKIKLATIAQRIWNATVMANPILAIVAGLAALAAGVVWLVKKLNQASAAQRALNEVQKEAEKAVASERNEIEQLVRIAKDERFSREEREKAMKRLNEISPEYLGNLSLETINTEEATQSIKNYIKAMEEKALVQAIDDKIAKLMEDNAEKEIDGTKGKLKWYQALGNAVLSTGNIVIANELNIRTTQRNAEKHERDYNKTLEALMAKRAEILSTGQSADGSTELTEAEKAEIAAAEEEKARKEAAAKAAAQRVKNAKKALEQLEESHQKELVELKRQMLEKGETQDWYNNQALVKELEYLTKKIELQKASGDDTLKTDEAILDKQIKLRENYQKNIDGINKTISDLENETFDLPEPDMEGFDEEYQKGLDALDRYDELKEKFKTDEDSQAEQFITEMDDLADAYDLGIINHEQYEKRKAEITKKYSGKSLEAYSNYVNAASDLVNGLGNMFAAQKEAELAKVGDNEDKKAAIEKKYAEKQKKVAMAQAAISAAQAIIQLWAQPSVIPEPFNSIFKGVQSAFIVGTTAAQIKKINQQQFYAGGFTDPGDKYSPAGIVHKGEFVGAQEAVQNPSVKRVFDIVDIAQQNGTISQLNLPQAVVSTYSAPIPNRGLASGGYANTSDAATSVSSNIPAIPQTDPVLIETMKQMTIAANRLAEKDVSISMSEFNKKSQQHADMQNSVNLKK
jgi:hypothetical protein